MLFSRDYKKDISVTFFEITVKPLVNTAVTVQNTPQKHVNIPVTGPVRGRNVTACHGF